MAKYKLLQEITMVQWLKEEDGIEESRKLLAPGTVVTSTYFIKNYRGYETMSGEYVVLNLKTKEVETLDVTESRMTLGECEEALTVQMLLEVPIELLSKWMTWPLLQCSGLYMEIVKARLEGSI